MIAPSDDRSPFDDDAPALAPTIVPTTAGRTAKPGRNGNGAGAAAPTISPASRRVRKGEEEAEGASIDGPVRIIRLSISGFKRVQAVELELSPEGLTVIGGRNRAGKTSILDAVQALLAGGRSIPQVPVKEGERQAVIVAELEGNNGTGYVVKRTIRPDRSGALEILRADGSPVNRMQEFLDAMTGVLWFDPLQFTTQEPKAQAETLRKLLGLDFSELDRRRAAIYEERTLIGRQRDRARGHADSLATHPDVPAEELSASELTAEISAIAQHNQRIDGAEGKIRKAAEWLDEAQRAEEKYRDRVEALREELAQAEALLQQAGDVVLQRQAQCDANLPALQAIVAEGRKDPQPVLARLADLEGVNRQIQDNRRKAEAVRAFEELAGEWDRMAAEIEAIDAEKRRQLAEAAMPVPGLGFSEDGAQVLLNELPLPQASGAEQIAVSVAMAAELAGPLRVALVDEGEKLDLVSLARLHELCKAKRLQILMTRVSEGDECSVVIEEGLVAA